VPASNIFITNLNRIRNFQLLLSPQVSRLAISKGELSVLYRIAISNTSITSLSEISFDGLTHLEINTSPIEGEMVLTATSLNSLSLGKP